MAVVLEAEVGADDDEGRVGRAVSLKEGEGSGNVFESLVRDDSSNGEDNRLAVRSSTRYLRRQVQQKRDDLCVSEAGVAEIARVEAGVGNERFDATFECMKRVSTAVAQLREVRVVVAEQLTGGDVVVAESDGSFGGERR